MPGFKSQQANSDRSARDEMEGKESEVRGRNWEVKGKVGE